MKSQLVLLHPLGVDRGFWLPVLNHLHGIPVATMDLAGHGTAPALAAGADLAAMAAAVLTGWDRLGLDRAAVVGVSLGALVATQLAATAPDRVSSLVLADAVAVYPEPMRTMWAARAATARADGMGTLVEPTMALWFSEPFRDLNGQAVRRTDDSLRSMSPEAYARACEILASADTRPMLGRIDCPTLILCGEDDGDAFRAAAPELRAHIAGAQLQWLPGRHAAAIEHPQIFAERLAEFLTDADDVTREASTTGVAP